MKIKRSVVIILSCTMLLSGCSLINRNKVSINLPDNAQSYTSIYDEDTGDITIKTNGKTYSYFGTIGDTMPATSVRDCLGYLDGDKNTRICTLTEDPNDNYIMVKNVNGIMEQPQFFRAMDTRNRDIFTPSYIEPLGFECWGSSAVHYEMAAASVALHIMTEGIKDVGYEVLINGESTFSGGVGYASGKVIKRGELFIIEITEFECGEKIKKGEAFNVEIHFSVTDANDEVHEAEGIYYRDMMLGAYCNGLELRQDDQSGYYIRNI